MGSLIALADRTRGEKVARSTTTTTTTTTTSTATTSNNNKNTLSKAGAIQHLRLIY